MTPLQYQIVEHVLFCRSPLADRTSFADIIHFCSHPAEPENPQNFAEDDVALAGPDGHKVKELLATAQQHGITTLSDIMTGAMNRLLDSDDPAKCKRLFNADELHQLAESFAATNATAELLGRSRIHERAERAGKSEFAEATPFTAFADVPKPLAPRAAVAYFKSLIPSLNIDPEAFETAQRRMAFSLAVDISQTLLERVKDIIAGHIEGTDAEGHGTADIQAILDEAGVAPENPQYAEMVYRTNMVDAYNEGSTAEIQAMPDMFPVWAYEGIADGRQRPAHEKHFGKYYPNKRTFAEVRDSEKGSFDGFNCRCTPVAIDKYHWEELQEQGRELRIDIMNYGERCAAAQKIIGDHPGMLILFRAWLDEMKSSYPNSAVLPDGEHCDDILSKLLGNQPKHLLDVPLGDLMQAAFTAVYMACFECVESNIEPKS